MSTGIAIPGTARPPPSRSSLLAPQNQMGVKPPYTPRPKPQQTWVHSCCTQSKLERALSDPDVSAIEADIMMGGGPSSPAGTRTPPATQRVPVMAHPTWRSQLPTTVDMTFGDFLERCIADGTRHLKLDFKELECVEPCLELLAQRWPQLHANGQAIWLNADVLPGPNARQACKVPAHTFLPLCRRLCPQAVLSLGWAVGPLGGEEVYTEADISDMIRLCNEYNVPGASAVFAASLRYSERCVPLFTNLLSRIPEAQILFWTGTGELPVQASTHARVASLLTSNGFTERVGFDVQIARSCCAVSGSRAIDCTFFWSRWSRWLCSCGGAYNPRLASGATTTTSGLGERQPLVRGSHNGMSTPNCTPPHSERLVGAQASSRGGGAAHNALPVPPRPDFSSSSDVSI